MSSPAISEVELNAYVDGEVLPERRAAIESWLARTPADAGRVETWRRQNEIIRAAFGRVAADTAPLHRQQASGEPVVRLETARTPVTSTPTGMDGSDPPIRQVERMPGLRWDGRIAAITLGSFASGAVVTLVVASLFGLAPAFLNGVKTIAGKPVEATVVTDFGPALASRAIEAYQTYGAEPADTVPVEAAGLGARLSARLGIPVPVPDLSTDRLRLLQGRLSPADIGPAAFVLYEAPPGERIGILVTRAPGEDSLRFAQGRGASVAIWITGGTGYAVVGASDRQRLLAVAERVRAAAASH